MPIRVLAALALLSTTALAQKQPKAAPEPPKAQQLVFGEGDTLEGDVPSAGGDLITGRPHVKHVSLLRVRSTFYPEMLKSAEDL